MSVVLIGLGGIGSNLVEPLCRLITYSDVEKKIFLIDGDKYEEKNRVRQRFTEQANKAEATKYWLQGLFPELDIEAKARFVDGKNLFLFVREDDVVFLAVDNHATRKAVHNHIKTLKNILLISGGNEELDGNIQIHIRKDGKDILPDIVKFHSEIENTKGRNPAELSCEELARIPSSNQILAVNFTIAALMLNAFTLRLKMKDLPYNEVYFDFLTGNVRAIKRT